MNRRLLFFVAILGVVAVVLGGIYLVQSKKNNNDSASQTENKPEPGQEVVKKDLEPDQIPEKFPKNIPIEKDAPIVQNFSATTANHNQATRSFISKQNIETNIKLYTDFLAANGYTVSPLNTDSLKSVIGRKGDTMVQVAAEQNSTTKVVTVTISFSERIVK